jgi:UDP-glucose 4-epimerase
MQNKKNLTNFVDAIKLAIFQSLRKDKKFFLMGEGVNDPSSMWGTIKGVARKFGKKRIVEMPISESGLIGAAIGAAINGTRVLVNLQRVEFSLYAFEQIINNAAKSCYISRGKHSVPIVIRLVVGRGWGQGPEHAQSFENIDQCFNSNLKGSYEVINFCLQNKIKIIYSATSASLGNNQDDQHLSPYAFTKSFNMNLIVNFNKWFKLNYEIVYFFNVYGPKQIKNSNMSAVIGIFEDQFLNKKKLTVVSPGTQTRRFTHVSDTVLACYKAWKKNKNSHYSISSNKAYSVLQVAKSFSGKIKYLRSRPGERFESKSLNSIRGIKIKNLKSKIDIKDYISHFLKKKY